MDDIDIDEHMYINGDELNSKYKTKISEGIKSGQGIMVKKDQIDINANVTQVTNYKKDKFNTIGNIDVNVVDIDKQKESKNLKDKLSEKLCKSIKSLDLKNANMNEIEDIIKNRKNIIKEPK